MKRVILAVCFLIASTVSYNASAQSAVAAVTASAFNAKVSQLDSYLGSGDTASARTTWNEIHNMMLQEFGAIKYQISTATSSTTVATYMNLHDTQYTYYKQAWGLKNDLVSNRTAIHTALMNYSGTL